jgi:hypothetical protein
LSAARVIEREPDSVVLGDVPGLGDLETLKPLAVAFDHFKGVPHLAEPEVEVGHLTGELVPVLLRWTNGGQLPADGIAGGGPSIGLGGRALLAQR